MSKMPALCKLNSLESGYYVDFNQDETGIRVVIYVRLKN